MQMARSPGHLLWTDDLIMGMIASSEWSVRRVWTQAVLGWLGARGHAGVELEERATLQLLMMSYGFTSIGARHFKRAGDVSDWKVDDDPLKRVLDEFANPTVELPSLAKQLGECLVTLWRSVLLDMSRQTVTFRLLDRTAQRPGGYDLITQIHDCIDLIFGFDPVNAERVRQVIWGWLRGGHHIILP